MSVLAFAVMASASLISYQRAKAESLGLDAKGGLMERAERVVLLCIGLLWDPLLVPVLWVMLALDPRHGDPAVREGVAPGRSRTRHCGADRDAPQPSPDAPGRAHPAPANTRPATSWLNPAPSRASTPNASPDW